MKRALCFLLIYSLQVYADVTHVYRPWTRSFMETKLFLSGERVSTPSRVKTLNQMETLLSTAPYPDWQADLGIAGTALDTGKIFLCGERMLFSDLLGSCCALSAFAGSSSSCEKRVKNPLFFEMAQHTFESGLSLGKHVFIGKDSYAQLFSNVLGGVGSRGTWLQLDLGMYYSFLKNHAVQCAYTNVRSFGHHDSFCGYASIRSHINALSVQYKILFDGIELFTQYSRLWVSGVNLSSANGYKIGFSYPIAI